MGLLDELGSAGGVLKNAGTLAELARQNPAAAQAAISLLSAKPGSIGPSDGLAGIIKAFQSKGLGDAVASWISTNPNHPVDGSQVTQALGHDTLKQFSEQSGVPLGDAAGVLARVLPTLIDSVSPSGKVPEPAGLEGQLGTLLGGLLGPR